MTIQAPEKDKTVRLSAGDHHKLKLISAETGFTVKELVGLAIPVLDEQYVLHRSRKVNYE